MPRAARQHYISAAAGKLPWGDLLEIPDAAERLGCSPGHLRRLCAEQLQDRRLAWYVSPPAGGNPRWFVHRDHDRRRLADNLPDADLTPDALREIDELSDRQRRRMWARVACVEALRRARSEHDQPVARWLPALIQRLRHDHPDLPLSRSRLYQWDRAYQLPDDALRLVDRRGGDRKTRGDNAVWQVLLDAYLDERQPSLRSCWERAAEHARAIRATWCDYDACRRQLPQRCDVETQLRHRDPRKWRSQYAPWVEQDAERYAAGQCWVSDHRPLDLLCRPPSPGSSREASPGSAVIRPVLTIWQDWRTRKIVGWTLAPTPNTSTILSALRMAILDASNGGPPEIAWMDNGKDYDAYALQGVTKAERLSGRKRVQYDEATFGGIFQQLGIEPHHSLAHCPQGKARCERVFATIAARFDKSFPTYTGRTPDRKPEQLAALVKSKPHAVPRFEHVVERFADWVRGHNATTDHQIDDLVDPATPGQRLSREEAFRGWRPSRRMVPHAAALDLCLQMWHKPVSVGRNGIRLVIAGAALRYGQFEPALRPYKGKGAVLHVSYDPADLSRVRVYDAELRHVTDAPLNVTGGRHGELSRDQLAEVIRRQRQRARAMDQVRTSHELEYLSTEEQLALGAPPAPPDTDVIQRLETPLDAAAMDLRAPLKRAAGSDPVPPPSPGVSPAAPPPAGGMHSAFDRLRERMTRTGYGQAPPPSLGVSPGSGPLPPLPSLGQPAPPPPPAPPPAPDDVDDADPWTAFRLRGRGRGGNSAQEVSHD
jgi:putative transposase